MRGSCPFLATASSILMLAAHAHADGLEDTVSGAVGLGRAANYLRVNDFMATWQNPANLAVIPSTDLGGELRLPVLHACFDRARDPSAQYRTNDPQSGFAGSESFDNVCNEGTLMPTGNLGWAQAFESGWGYGVGFFTPALVPNLKYGAQTIVTQFPLAGEVYPTTPNGTESPNRFMLLQRSILGGFLQAGAGFQPLHALRLGASVGVGFADIRNLNVASVQGGTFRDQEILTDAHVTDWAIPRATLSAVVSPSDALEFMGALTYQGDVHATGSVDLTANGIQGAPLANCTGPAPPGPGPHCRIENAELTVPFPRFQALLSTRYAQRRSARKRALDPLKDEVWDVEVDGYWSQTSHIDQYTLKLYDEPPGSAGAANLAFSSAPGAAVLATPQRAIIPRHWRDTFGVRIGGDYNVVPALLALRVGFSYETRAVPVEYMNVDAYPVARLGLHCGATLALSNWKLTAGYEHLFYQSIEVGVGAGRVDEIVSQNPAAAQAVNEGYYQAAQDIFSLQANVAL
jgi:hypothetical protein